MTAAADLTAASWKVFSELLDRALELAPAERWNWLDTLGAEHGALKPMLRAVLERSSRSPTAGWLDTLPHTQAAEMLVDESNLQPDALVGPYRLVRELGVGGMGTVWLAERADGSLKRQVALKLPRTVWSSGLAQRMARERDILASLEHPLIARLYDAGLDQHGRPYLALEYVDGLAIDAYCDARHLTIRQRVALILQVASAVAFAHSRLVVHRDLKPSNILVTADGQVRLLDFGIAKLLALADDTGQPSDLTAVLGQRMTINYASPEQLQEQSLTTASDQYSLAVVTYELLCAARPHAHRREAGLKLANVVVDIDPPALSRRDISAPAAAARGTTGAGLRKLLAGDLDAILQRALMRAPSQRYPSVDAFADDLRRWLEGQPVSTRPHRAAYVARKFVARHRTATLMAAASLLAVLVASSAAVVFGLHANDESLRAQATRDFMIALFDRANPFAHGGRDISAREMLRLGELEIERLEQQPVLQRDVLKTLSTLRYNFGDYDAAAATQRAVSARLEAEGARLPLVESLVEEARIAVARENWSDVQARLVEAESVAPRAGWPAALRARADIQRGWYEMTAGDINRSATMFEAARHDARRAQDANLEVVALRGRVNALLGSADQDQLLETVRQANELLGRLPSARSRAHLSLMQTLAEGFFFAGRYQEGWPVAERMVAEVATFYSDPAAHVRQRLIWLRYCLKLEQARTAAQWLEGFEGRSPDLTAYGTYTRGQWHAMSARIWAAVGNRERSAATLAKAWYDAEASQPESLQRFMRQHVSLAEGFAAVSLNDPAAALRTLNSEVWTSDPSAAPYRSWVIGIAMGELGENEKAAIEFERALKSFNLPPGHPHVAVVRLNLVLTRLRLMGSAAASAATWREFTADVASSQDALSEAFGPLSPVSQTAAQLRSMASSGVERPATLAALALRRTGFEGRQPLFQ